MSMLIWLVPVCAAVALLLIGSANPLFVSPRVYAEAAAGLLIASFPFIVTAPFAWPTRLALCLVQLWALILPARIIFGRLGKDFVYPSTRKAAWLLLAISVGIPLLSWAAQAIPVSLAARWMLFVTIVILVQAFFLAHILWSLWHYRLQLRGTKRTLNELPTVSVCIPARNETHALEDCLVSVLASTYQKLEVLVLDDCSQDATSQIIRSFAHDGVRFVHGEQPAEGWLGKNQALQTLAAQASGDIIIFLDVDTRVTPDSVTQLVNYALDNNLEMATILPQNRLGLQPGALGGTLRYFWQLALPLTPARVPVASQAWLIRASSLKALGGFASVAHAIVPERTFARQLAERGVYRFIASNLVVGVTTAKRWPSVVESAARLLYPTYKRQPMYALLGISVIAAAMVIPMVILVWLLVSGDTGMLTVFTAVAVGMALLNYALVLQRTHPRVWPLAALLLPLVSLQEIILLAVSMALYEFGEVNWKGRNVCYPVILSAQIPLANRASRAARAHR